MNDVTGTHRWRAIDRQAHHTIRVAAVEPDVIARARTLAADLLRDDPTIYEHSSRAARRAAFVTHQIPSSRTPDVVAAAWLHDIGYSARLVRTGFHPLDGALFLMSQDWPERIVRLVAHHSLASLEAPFHGVGHHLGVIESVSGIDADVLTSADLVSGPGDPPPTVDARLEAMRLADAELGLVPEDVRQARYAGLRAAHLRVEALL